MNMVRTVLVAQDTVDLHNIIHLGLMLWLIGVFLGELHGRSGDVII